MSGAVQTFCEQLVRLNGAMAELFRSGNVSLLTEMNAAIKELHRVQHKSTEPALAAIDGDCVIIYGNFDMIISILRTTENGEIDRDAQKAMNVFLHNIDDAVVRIASAFGLIE